MIRVNVNAENDSLGKLWDIGLDHARLSTEIDTKKVGDVWRRDVYSGHRMYVKLLDF